MQRSLRNIAGFRGLAAHESSGMRQSIAESLGVLRRRRKRPLYILLSLPAVFAVFTILQPVLGRTIDIVAGVVLCAVGAAFVVAIYVAEFSRCPRCGKFFFMSFFGKWLFARKCEHCGLSLSCTWDGTAGQRAALREWLEQAEGRGPLPDVGLHCPRCGYLLTGLVESRCPECGTEVAIRSILDGVESSVPPRRQAN